MPLLISPVQYDTSHSCVVKSFIALVVCIITLNLNLYCSHGDNTHNEMNIFFPLKPSTQVIVIDNNDDGIEQKGQVTFKLGCFVSSPKLQSK